MGTWDEFAAAAPEMAVRGGEQLGVGLAYLATVRRDGAPRLHPVSPILAAGRLFVAVGERSPKRLDLARDGRYSMHALPPPPGTEGYDEFEFNITGRARRVDPSDVATWSAVRKVAGHVIHDADSLFEFEIESALTTVWLGLFVEGESPTPERHVWGERET